MATFKAKISNRLLCKETAYIGKYLQKLSTVPAFSPSYCQYNGVNLWSNIARIFPRPSTFLKLNNRFIAIQHIFAVFLSLHYNVQSLIFTARKRSLGQGNAFTGICHSFCPEGGGFTACITGHMTGGSASRRGTLGRPPGPAYRGRGNPAPPETWDTTGYGQQAGGTHPTGMHSRLSILC